MSSTNERDGRPSSEFISVVLCTYNRPAKLRRCLTALLAMNVIDTRWELICVDNNSTDETKEVIQEFIRSSLVPIRYVFERAQGLACARNAGLRQASGDIFALTDDDCLADPNWLVAISREFREDTSLAMLGGRVEPHNKDYLPVGIRTSPERVTIGLTNVFTMIGAGNMGFRRRVMATIGMFDPDFGAGSSLFAAEDSDFAYRALRAGLKVVYSPDVVVFHDHGRESEQDLNRIEKAYVTARGAFYLKHTIRCDAHVMRLAYWESLPLLKQAARELIGRERRGSARFLGYLLRGAYLYLRAGVRAFLAPRKSRGV